MKPPFGSSASTTAPLPVCVLAVVSTAQPPPGVGCVCAACPRSACRRVSVSACRRVCWCVGSGKSPLSQYPSFFSKKCLYTEDHHTTTTHKLYFHVV